MKPFIKCKIEYFYSTHLSQIYVGFDLLQKRGIIDVVWSKAKASKYELKPLLNVTIDNKYHVIFDTLDGLNWINGSIEENINYFRNNIRADYYFKRSFNDIIVKYAPDNCQVFPLGFNYNIAEKNSYGTINEKLKKSIKNIEIIRLIFKKVKKNFYTKDYEFYPIVNSTSRILFLTRLWRHDNVTQNLIRADREVINANRINCINACKKEYKNLFIGGLLDDSFSRKYAKDLISPYTLTNKDSYLKAIKDHNICIATTGLHNSVGWKLGEYIAASRAIITEPLFYDQPGIFENGKNYLNFTNSNELIEAIDGLINNKEKMQYIMRNNYEYYNNYLRPDILVLNALMVCRSGC